MVEEIPAGRVATYGQIAKLIGREKNSRWTEQEWLLKGEGATLKENGCVLVEEIFVEC